MSKRLWDEPGPAHLLPLAGWLLAMHLLGDPEGWKYAARVGVGLGLLLVFRPWRWSGGRPGADSRALAVPLLAGVTAYLLWVLPELGVWPESWGDVYRLVGMQPPWRMTEVDATPVYTGGWAVIRLTGAVLVIPVIEEFAWRGWLYRWIVRSDFLRVDPARLHWGAAVFSSVLFASVHTRWAAAFVCGLLYLWVYQRSRNLWAAVGAHAVTNLLLGVHVVAFGAHQFW